MFFDGKFLGILFKRLDLFFLQSKTIKKREKNAMPLKKAFIDQHYIVERNVRNIFIEHSVNIIFPEKFTGVTVLKNQNHSINPMIIMPFQILARQIKLLRNRVILKTPDKTIYLPSNAFIVFFYGGQVRHLKIKNNKIVSDNDIPLAVFLNQNGIKRFAKKSEELLNKKWVKIGCLGTKIIELNGSKEIEPELPFWGWGIRKTYSFDDQSSLNAIIRPTDKIYSDKLSFHIHHYDNVGIEFRKNNFKFITEGTKLFVDLVKENNRVKIQKKFCYKISKAPAKKILINNSVIQRLDLSALRTNSLVNINRNSKSYIGDYFENFILKNNSIVKNVTLSDRRDTVILNADNNFINGGKRGNILYFGGNNRSWGQDAFYSSSSRHLNIFIFNLDGINKNNFYFLKKGKNLIVNYVVKRKSRTIHSTLTLVNYQRGKQLFLIKIGSRLEADRFFQKYFNNSSRGLRLLMRYKIQSPQYLGNKTYNSVVGESIIDLTKTYKPTASLCF